MESHKELRNRRFHPEAEPNFLTSGTVPLGDEEDECPTRKTTTRFSYRRRVAKLLLLILFFVNLPRFIVPIEKCIHNIEKRVQSPHARAKIFNPYRTFKIQYYSKEQPQTLKNFTTEHVFVVNMDKDVKRMEQFKWKNRKLNFTRVSGYEWNKDDEQHHVMFQKQFPSVKKAIRNGRLGDAGCFLSHVLLIERELVAKPQRQHILVLEDDVQVLQTALHVMAPQDADMVFLAKTATKLVEVFLPESEKKATRVIGGFGSIGYIITQTGAKQLFECLRRHMDNIDLVFFACTSLRVYLPFDDDHSNTAVARSYVRHFGKDSTRINANQ